MTETRAEKAQRLVDHGAIEIIRSVHLFTEAFVRGDHSPHATIIYRNGHFYCSCDWGQHNSYTDDLCAHALAVKLAVEKKS